MASGESRPEAGIVVVAAGVAAAAEAAGAATVTSANERAENSAPRTARLVGKAGIRAHSSRRGGADRQGRKVDVPGGSRLAFAPD